jgi:hypothetical protein
MGPTLHVETQGWGGETAMVTANYKPLVITTDMVYIPLRRDSQG